MSRAPPPSTSLKRLACTHKLRVQARAQRSSALWVWFQRALNQAQRMFPMKSVKTRHAQLIPRYLVTYFGYSKILGKCPPHHQMQL